MEASGRASYDASRGDDNDYNAIPERPSSSERCACGAMTTIPEYKEAFGVNLCSFCKSSDELLTKAKAKQLYMLSDGDIAHLGSLKRDNPMKPQWSSMRLYLQSQVEQVAVRKWGSLQEMEQQRRSSALLHTHKRRRDAQNDRTREVAERERIKVTRKRIEREWEAADLSEGAKDERHQRVNAGEGVSDGEESEAVFVRTYANGTTVEVEEI